MKNAPWFAAIGLAFVAGYLTRGVNQEIIHNPAQTERTPKINNASDSITTSEQLSAVAKTVFTAKEKTTPAQSTAEPQPETVVAPQAKTDTAQVADSNNSTAKKYPNEISDEDIDKVIPAPFNLKLKNHHGDLREKYKDFAATNQQLEWDKNMQNKLSDSILGNPYAKFIILESLQCKANLCEIRLYETKDGAWSLIMAEMRLQDWWDIGGSSASGFGTDTPSKTGWYVLLPRR